MRYFLFVFLFLTVVIPTASAQLLYPEVMETRELNIQPIKASAPLFPANLSKLKRSLPDNSLDNPGIRYVLQNIKKAKYSDTELNAALNQLLRYVENDTLRSVVDYLRDYVQTTAKTEEALNTVKTKLAFDSIEFFTQDAHLITSDYDTYLNSDLVALVSFMQQDSNYRWLKDITRDSVFLEILNTADNSIKFWINNGRNNYHRFWATNKLGDSIGTWIQAMPHGNNLRVYVDDDVYQAKVIDTKKIRKSSLANQLGDSYYNIRKAKERELSRRYWTYYSEFEAAMGQGYQANWASGGENSLSVLTNVRYFVNYNKNKTSWENFMHYRLGFLRSGSEDIRKNEDRLELNSKLGKKAFKHWFYTAQLNIQTLIFNSYEYPNEDEKKIVANFMTPAYFTLSLGLDYKPNDNFSLYLSPLAGKWTYVRDTTGIDPTRYGVEQGKKSKSDAGARLELRNKFSLFKIMDIRNELTLFSSYYNDLQRFAGDWKVQVDFKINYFMRASVYTNVVYDENYSKKLQFRETLNLGVNFRF